MKLNTLFVQILKELNAIFPELKPLTEIYAAPKITWVSLQRPIELQVAEAGTVLEFRDGSLRSEQVRIVIGIFRQLRKDYESRHVEALTEASLSIFNLRDRIVSGLDGSFLNNLITRPLMLTDESGAIDNEKFPGVLVKEMVFVLGVNTRAGS